MLAYPLTPLQSGLLVAAARHRRASLDLVQQVFDITGTTEPDLLRTAWQSVLDRHEGLRCAFLWQGLRRPVQAVATGLPVPWQVIDWRDDDPEDSGKRWEELLEKDRATGFDLTKPPLLRLSLIREERGESLLWTYHHITIDGWSDSILLDEVMDCYSSLLAGESWRPAPAPPLGRYFAWMECQDQEAATAYWTRTMGGFEGPLPLVPAAQTHDEGTTDGIGTVELILSEELSRRIGEFARNCRVTVNTVLHAAWAILEARLTGQRDVVFGTTVSGRDAPVAGIESVVGMFLNTLPFRVGVPASNRTGSWLREVQQRLVELRDFGYSSISEAHRHSAVPVGQPLFHTAFVFENMPRPRMDRASGISLRPREGWGRTGFPLTVKAGLSDRLWVELTYEEEVFDRAAVQRLTRCLEQALTDLVAVEDAAVDAIDVCDPAETRSLLAAWDANDWPEAATLPTVPQLVAWQARAHPERIAVTEGEQSINYGELYRRAGRLARALTEAGAGRERTVGICLPRGIDAVVAMLAVMRARAAYLPLDPAYPAQRLEFMLADSGADILVTEEHLAPLFADATITHVVMESRLAGLEAYDAVDDALPSPDDLAYLIYTSGSTGTPKATAIEHGCVARLIQNTNWITVSEYDVIAQTTNLSFDPSVFECWAALGRGARLAVISRAEVLDPAALVAAIRRERVTVLFLTTMMVNRMIDEEPDFARGLRVLMFGGEMPDLGRIAKLMESDDRPAELLHIYGPTEVGVYSSAHSVPVGGDVARGLSVGIPMSNNSLYLLDDRLRPVPPGYPGDIWIGGPGVGRGYLGRPRLTAEKFRPDPYAGRDGARLYDSGDRGYRRPDGTLMLLGRLDNQVKIRGHRVEPAEVEHALRQDPGLREAVVRVDRSAAQPRLVAYIVPANEVSTAVQDAAARLRTILPDHMVPSAFHVMKTLPVSVNGKVDHTALPAPKPARLARDDFAAPQSATEAVIARAWGAALGLEKVGRGDDFFELGGHSLQATSVMSQIGRELKVDLPLSALFERRTVSRLADLADDAAAQAIFRGSHTDGVVRLGGRGGTPLFLFHEGTGNIRRYIPLAGMLDDAFTVYGIPARGLDSNVDPIDDVGAMVQGYLDAIRRVQPRGPFLLGGWSFGGVLAVEAARQLRAVGEKVRPVVVIDSAPPSERVREHLRSKDGPYDALHALVTRTADQRPWPDEETRGEILDALWNCELNPHLVAAGPDALARLARVASANRRALAAYRFSPYSGQVRLFLARKGFVDELGPEIVDDWRECVRNLVIDWVSGKHLTVVDDPHIRPVAAAIRELP